MRKIANEELNRLSVEDFKSVAKKPLVIVLDNIRSLNNIGSVFRTADAFLVEKIYLCGITATPPHREIHKTALGATESIAWEYVENTIDCIEQLKDEGYKILSVEQAEGSTMLQNFQPNFTNEKYVLVFGNEVDGVADEVIAASDYCVEIPQYGTKHSLNISVSVGIVVWELCK
jgi:tRNA G18 (ribose-2'-O)-methylase SpoU